MCEVADEPVVVMKFRPVKAGNRVEGKTGMTAVGYSGQSVIKSDWLMRRGEVTHLC